MSVKSKHVTKDATAKRVQAAPAVMNRVRGLAGNHTLMRVRGASEAFQRQAHVQADLPVGRMPEAQQAYHEQQEYLDEVQECIPGIQRKSLEVSNPSDADEREADEVARKVINGHSAGIHGTGGVVNRKAEVSAEAAPDLQSRLDGGKGTGQSLPRDVQMEMSSRMGTDFNSVRVHTGVAAHEMAASINARAFTLDSDVYFRQGEYNPNSKVGKELIAHELVHTQQHGATVQPLIHRQKDPKELKPNKNDSRLMAEEDQGAKGYMPDKEQFKTGFSKLSAEEKMKLVDDFVNEFFGYYKELSAPSVNVFQKSLNIKKLAEDVEKSDAIRGIPISNQKSISGKMLTNTTADWGKIKLPDQKKKHEGYASMMVLDPTENKEALDLLEWKKANVAAYQSELRAKIDKGADAVAALVTSLRRIGDYVNRLYAVYSASKATGMPFNDVMALYGQEGFFTMPSSSRSLETTDDSGKAVPAIPSPETAGVSIAGFGGSTFDFSTMNLTVPQSNNWKDMGGRARQLSALMTYSVQIAGSDVVFKLLEGKPATVSTELEALAKWSLDNRKRCKNDPSMPASELADTDANLEAKFNKKWEDMVNGITELPFEHRKAKTIKDLDKVWVYAPKDPALLTAFILTESAFLLKAHQNKPRTLLKGNLMFDSPLAYMMYNSTSIKGDDYMKKMIEQAVRDAKKLASANTVSDAMTDDLRNDLLKFAGKDFASISKWVTDKPDRWKLLMNFMEKAGQEEWKPTWVDKKGNPISKQEKMRNASNFRTLSEFYKKVMEQK